MICIDVKRNDDRVCCAAIEDALLLTPSIGAWVGGNAAQLDIRGMCELPGNRNAHVDWSEFTELYAGDTIQFTLCHTSVPSAPLKVKPTDAAEYIGEQREFEEMERNFVAPTEKTSKRYPNLSLQLFLNESFIALATLKSNEEHILCTLTWEKWHPERCRVFVRSFEGLPRTSERVETSWYRSDLAVGDTLKVVIGA